MNLVSRRLLLLGLAAGTLGVSSCGLVRSAIQIPARTLQGVGRTAGFGLKATEISNGGAQDPAKTPELIIVKKD